MGLSYNLGYQESISVHPTRRQNFAGKVYSIFPNIWQWVIQLAIGPSEDPTARGFQFVGILASLLSITKGVAEWWVKGRKKGLIQDAPLTTILLVSLFFLPHVIFRTTAIAFTAAFLGYYALVPFLLAIVIVLALSIPAYNAKRRGNQGDESVFLGALGTTIFAPVAYHPWADLEFVKKFTGPNFRVKEFYTLKTRKSRLFSPALNSENASLSVIWPSFG